MRNQKGITTILVALIIFILVAVVALFLLNSSNTPQEEIIVSENDNAIQLASEPVSTDTDTTTLEKELDDTMVGSPDEDVNGMLEEASTL